jgi:hypothetical protein
MTCLELYTLAYYPNIRSLQPYLKLGVRRGILNEDIHVTDRVIITRDIRAGLSEKGPLVCSKGKCGVVVKIEKAEPDGVHVRLDTGSLWWFKPNQIKIIK